MRRIRGGDYIFWKNNEDDQWFSAKDLHEKATRTEKYLGGIH